MIDKIKKCSQLSIRKILYEIFNMLIPTQEKSNELLLLFIINKIMLYV